MTRNRKRKGEVRDITTKKNIPTVEGEMHLNKEGDVKKK